MPLLFFTDPPEIEIEQNWYEREGLVEVELICVVHAKPPAEVSREWQKIASPLISISKYRILAKANGLVWYFILSTLCRFLGIEDKRSFTRRIVRYSSANPVGTRYTSEMSTHPTSETSLAGLQTCWARPEHTQPCQVSCHIHSTVKMFD